MRHCGTKWDGLINRVTFADHRGPTESGTAVPKDKGVLGGHMATAKKRTKPAIRLAKLPKVSLCKPCERAAFIAESAHAACDALLGAYELVRQQRGRPRGMTTDNEQDLLRSMLVMAGAGVDATVKQLIEDALPQLISVDSKAQNSFEKFVMRRLVSSDQSNPVNLKLLSMALTSSDPQARLIREYVSHLTGGSLQSADSLFEVAAALGSDPNSIGLVLTELRPIFEVRNKIIHELDVDVSARKRTRNVRSQSTMIRHTERLFTLVTAMLNSVHVRLSKDH
jgi:hypothetical protein